MIAETFSLGNVVSTSSPRFFLPPDQSNLAPAIFELPVEVILWGETCIPGWKILDFFPVKIVHDTDGYYNAGDEIFGVYGDGFTSEAALEDYKIALVEFYELVEEGAQDNPCDQALFIHLQQYLRRMP